MKQLGILFLLFFSILSCSRDEGSQRPSALVSNEKSLFQEVKEQTVKNPNDAEAWYHLAYVYERSQMYREEIDALKKVIAIKPDRGDAYIKLGSAYNRLGQYPDAVKSFNLALKYLPKNPLIYNNLAVSYGMIGKTNDEISSLEKAIALRPSYATARYNLGVVLLKKGRRAEALKQYNELKKFDEGTALALKKEIDTKGK